MSEKFPVAEPYLEAVYSVSHKEFLEAQEEEEKLMKQMEKLFATTDREEAERIFLEKLAPRIQEAKVKSTQALQDWLGATDDLLE